MKKIRTLMTLIITIPSVAIAQNVGIGNNNPTKGKLDIVGVAGSGNTNAIFGSNVNGISLQQNWPTIGFNQYRDNTIGNGKFMSSGYAAIQFMDPGGGGMYFDMLGSGTANTTTGSGSRALALLPNGNVGIHCDGSSATLTVSRGTGTDGTCRFEGTTNTSHFNYGTNEDTYIRAGKDGRIVYVNDVSNGIISLGAENGNNKVGINVVNPGQYSLCIREVLSAGESRGILLLDRNSNNTWELRNDYYDFAFVFNGNPLVGISGATGNYYHISDKRVKKNFEEIPAVLDKVMELQPMEYDMINGKAGSPKEMGFIAQDVEKIFPSLVTVYEKPKQNAVYGDITDLHMMNYSGFGVIAIKAIQEQQTEIETLRAEIAELKKMINDIKAKHE